jgi:phospholipid/cholesterol/gamma-HCH transport system substrate-binding protein
MESRRERGLHPALWTLILVVLLAALVFVTMSLYLGSFTSYVPVTLTSDRAGLVMESGAKVKMRGIEVGRVSQIQGAQQPVKLKLDIFPDQIKYIPANVGAQIRATTAFGAKYVDLIYPSDPSPKRLAAGAIIQSRNVSTEVNTVFQNLTDVIKQVDPAKLNAVLSAVADGLRGEGPRIGEATTDANQVLMALNPRAETVRRDWQSLKGFSDTYGAAAQNIVTILDAASTTSATITSNAQALDSLLVNVVGFSRSGINLIGPNKDNLVRAINLLEPTTRLLMKYNPELTCLLIGGKLAADQFLPVAGGFNGYSVILDAGILLGGDQYKYPDNLPITGARGGPGGKPGCGSLPDVAQNWPVRYLVTNTGWGTACGPTRESASQDMPTTSRSPAGCPNPRASVTRADRRRDRSRTRARRRTGHSSTRRTEHRCIPDFPRHRRRARHRSRALGRGQSHSFHRSQDRCSQPRCRHRRRRRRHRPT